MKDSGSVINKYNGQEVNIQGKAATIRRRINKSMYGNDKKDRWKHLQDEKIEPPQTTRSDRIRFGFFLGGILVAIILIIFILMKI